MIEKSDALGVAMINEKLGKIYDALCQILRVIGPEGGKRG